MSSRVGSRRHRSRCRSPASPRRPVSGLLPTPSESDEPQSSTALYLSYPHPIKLPSDAVFSRVFGRYGTIERLFAHRTPRIYVIVEYRQPADAETARSELYLNDSSGKRRAELGDSRLSISFKRERPPVKAEIRKPFWTGKLLISGLSQAAVTACQVEGESAFIFSSLPQVTIAHRAPVTEVLMKDAVAVVVFTGASDEDKSVVGDFAAYFYSKQRAGFAQMQKHALYILPPGPEAVRFVPAMQADQLAGVLVQSH